MIGRRGFITGLVALVAAPAIVRAGSLMPVKVMIERPPNVFTLEQLEKAWLKMAERAVNPVISAAMTDLGAFGSSAILIDHDGCRHVPIREFYR